MPNAGVSAISQTKVNLNCQNVTGITFNMGCSSHSMWLFENQLREAILRCVETVKNFDAYLLFIRCRIVMAASGPDCVKTIDKINNESMSYLRTVIGQDDRVIEWTVVRLDSLINETKISEFTVHLSPTRSAIFNSGETSRINVGCFMANLICDDQTRNEWNGQMPVIYNLTHVTVLARNA